MTQGERSGGDLRMAADALCPPAVSVIVRDVQWYCVHAKPRQETACERYCRDLLGLETFYPKLKRQKTLFGAKHWIIGPLFPRYLFCRMDLRTHYRAVRYAPEAVNIVSFGDRPVEVEQSIIDGLKSWASEPVNIISVTRQPKPGDWVEITDGPFRGLQAIFEREMSDSERVSILLTTLATRPGAIVNRSQVALVA